MGNIAMPDPHDWPVPRAGDAGVSGDMQAALERAVAAGEYYGLHSLLVVRNGSLAFERHFPGQDENWGSPLGWFDHTTETRHDLRSVTKSIVGLLYGMALSEARVPPPHTRLVDALPGYEMLFDNPLKRRITLAHVLSMRMGLAWNEDLTYSNPLNGERLMEAAPDRVAHVLSQPMAERPGRRWTYCGGATVVLGHLIERGTGLPLDVLARQILLEPLGIRGEEWARWSDGAVAASSGLRLTARDLARIVQLILDKGLWRGQRIVPASWIVASMKPRAVAEPGLRYGYQWWIGQLAATGKPWHAAYGNGGQRLIVIPALRLVVVIFAGNYNTADQWKMPVRLMSRIVLPALL